MRNFILILIVVLYYTANLPSWDFTAVWKWYADGFTPILKWYDDLTASSQTQIKSLHVK